MSRPVLGQQQYALLYKQDTVRLCFSDVEEDGKLFDCFISFSKNGLCSLSPILKGVIQDGESHDLAALVTAPDNEDEEYKLPEVPHVRILHEDQTECFKAFQSFQKTSGGNNGRLTQHLFGQHVFAYLDASCDDYLIRDFLNFERFQIDRCMYRMVLYVITIPQCERSEIMAKTAFGFLAGVEPALLESYYDRTSTFVVWAKNEFNLDAEPVMQRHPALRALVN